MPVLIPVLFSFAMTFGYALLFLGHVLVSSALGEIDHPAGPSGTPPTSPKGSAAGSGRPCSASCSGGSRWRITGSIAERSTGSIGSSSRADHVGAGYAQMALAASLLHENIIAANPITVVVVDLSSGRLLPAALPGRQHHPGPVGAGRLGLALQAAQHVDGGRGSLGVLAR